MLHPELAARITASKAAVADYKREYEEWLNHAPNARKPLFGAWADRFAAELSGLAETVERLAQ